MNCADIRVTGTTGGGSSGAVSKNFLTNFQYASGYGCRRVNENTHFSASFGAVNTNYNSISTVTSSSSSNGGVSTVSETPNSVNHNVCYLNPYKAINVNHEISLLGRCGNGNNDYRCDDGSCCSQYGYCGSSAGYCSNAIGDWRTTLCSSAAFENNPIEYVAEVDSGLEFGMFELSVVIIFGAFFLGGVVLMVTWCECHRWREKKYFEHNEDNLKKVVQEDCIEIITEIEEDGQQMNTTA